MTNEQLKAAAYKLCELRGMNPEVLVVHGPPPDANGVVLSVALYSPQWQLIAEEIRYHLQFLEAIEYGKGFGE